MQGYVHAPPVEGATLLTNPPQVALPRWMSRVNLSLWGPISKRSLVCGPQVLSSLADRSDVVGSAAQVRTPVRSHSCFLPPGMRLVPRLQSDCALFFCQGLVYLALALTLGGSGACSVLVKLLETFFFNHFGSGAKKPIYSVYFNKSILCARHCCRCGDHSSYECCSGEEVLTVCKIARLAGEGLSP